MSRPSLRALTGIRFLAAYHVVLFHCTDWVHWTNPWARSFVGSGYVAVSLFFVLSGFILTYTHCGEEPPKPIALRPFYVSRFARIYPVYAVGLLLMAPFFVVAHLRKGDLTNLAVEGLAVLTLIQAYFPRIALAWNVPAWSLSAEAFFYLVFPLLAPIVVRSRTGVAVGTAILAWTFSVGACILYITVQPDGVPVSTSEVIGFWINLLKYSPILRLPDFVIGIVAGRLFLDRRVRTALAPHAPWMSFAVAGLVLAVLVTAERIPYVMLHNGLLSPLFAVLVIALAFGTGPLARALSIKVMGTLGEASYSLYILHLPLLILTLTAMKRLLGAPAAGYAFVIAFQIAIVLLSVVCFRQIEIPMRDRVRDALLRGGARRIVKSAA